MDVELSTRCVLANSVQNTMKLDFELFMLTGNVSALVF